MKQFIYLLILSVLLNAEPISKEDFLKKMAQLEEEEQESKVAIKKADEFNRTLEVLAKRFEEEKFERKQKENRK